MLIVIGRGKRVGKVAQKVTVTIVFTIALVAGVLSYQATRPDFSTHQGQTYQWRELEGKWGVINYFAPWCAPCLREMPELHAFAKSTADNVYTFAINYDPMSTSQRDAMLTQFNISLDVIVVDEGTVLPMKKPAYLPATYIVSPKGEVVDTVLGEVTAELLHQRLARLQLESR